jgi:hypothetical protein
MALIQCSECGTQISDRAAACPKCGHPQEAVLPPGVSGRGELSEDFTSSIGIVMRLVRPGSLQINQRNLSISTGYYLGVTQVTQAQWQAVMVGNPSHFAGRPSHPVENVSWIDAREFCRRLTEIDISAGKLPVDFHYDLPTEAQWEYACRAGGTGDFAGPLKPMAWYGGPLRFTFSTRPVATKAPNPVQGGSERRGAQVIDLKGFGNVGRAELQHPSAAALGGEKAVGSESVVLHDVMK